MPGVWTQGITWFDMDELILIQSAKKGDLDAFNRLVLAYQDQAFNVALRILADEYLAEDATQDAFLSAYRNISGFRGGSFRAWILKILTNRCYDEFRRQKRQPSQSLEPVNNDGEEELEDPIVLKDEQHLPESEAEKHELESAIQNCIEGLSCDFRTVVVLVDIQGLDYQEACQIIQKPLGTLKSRLARARNSLQKCLQDVWELLPTAYRLKDKGSHE
jgi:RNA polymerase sigma-70 factor (ECF subfamily)